MSGIFGAANAREKIDFDTLAVNMGRAMSHHPWIKPRHTCTGQAMIGCLGIGIFNRSDQPIFNDDRSLELVMAGEIYEADGLNISGQNDLSEQVALSMYEKYGDSFAAHMEGTFVIAVHDHRNQKVILTNDRWGLYPTYYTFNGSQLVFAPEIKAVMLSPGFSTKADRVALAQYTRWQSLIGNRTFFEDIFILPNAVTMVFDLRSSKLSILPYWDFSQIENLEGKISFDEAVEEGSRLLDAAVNRLTHRSNRLGLFLTSGLDSRAILGFIDKDIKPVTVTFGTAGSHDAVFAKELAKKRELEHHFFEFSDGKWVRDYADYHLDLTEGFHSWIHMHGISILPTVKGLMDVNLSGFEGTELNWDDDSLLQAPDDTAYNTLLYQQLIEGTTWPSLNEGEYRSLFHPKLHQDMSSMAWESFIEEVSRYSHLPNLLRLTAFSRVNPDRRMYQYYTVFNRSHIEQRFPFYDYRYQSFVLGLPIGYRRHRRLRKAIIARKMPELGMIIHDKDGLPVSENKLKILTARYRKKTKNFVNQKFARVFKEYPILHSDYENWLRTDLRAWGEELLTGERTVERGVFNPDSLRSLWQRHLSGLEVNIIGKFSPIMSWEMLMRRFIDGEPMQVSKFLEPRT